MLEFAHALTGATLATKIPSPLISLPLSLASHFLLDLLPHWDPSPKKEEKKIASFYLSPKIISIIIFDSLVALLLGLSLASKALPDLKRSLAIIAGAFLAVLPDLAEIPYLFFNNKNRLIRGLLTFQRKHQSKISFLPGLFTQILYATLLLFWIFKG